MEKIRYSGMEEKSGAATNSSRFLSLSEPVLVYPFLIQKLLIFREYAKLPARIIFE